MVGRDKRTEPAHRRTTVRASDSLAWFSDFLKQRFQFGLIQRHRSEALLSAGVFCHGERLVQPEAALDQVAHLTGVTRQAKRNHRFSGKPFSDWQQRVKCGLETTG